MDDKERVSWTLDGVLDISRVGDLRTELAGFLEAGYPLVIEAEDAERVDGALLQLLCAFRQAATVAGMEMAWGSVSQALREAAGLTGLTEALGLADAS